MLDYEINGYTVEYHKIGAACNFVAHFDTEDEAIEYIKDNRHKWDNYILIQYRTAVIDF